MAFEARVLGPVEAAHDGRIVALGSPKQRAVFALLVLSPGRVVPTERIVDELWGEQPPESPASQIQVYISRLRRSLRVDPVSGAGGTGTESVRLLRRGPGYQLDIPQQSVDAHAFADLVATARTLLADRPADARQVLDEALGMPRGPALADVVATLGPTGAAEARRLDDLRLVAQQLRLEALVAQGDAATAAADATALVREHPLQEDLRAVFMLALYRSGRQAEALAAYDSVRALLADELGVDPGAALRALHARILAQDPALDAVREAHVGPSAADRHVAAPPRKGGAAIGRLPEPLTTLVGRDDDTEEVRRALSGSRLVSLVGSGGAGKTRLALAAARGGSVPTRWVDLAVLDDPLLVPRVVGFALSGHEATEGDALQTAVERLGDEATLLVLDSCEHVAAASADAAAQLLAGCPNLTVLVTSREPLGVPGEVVWPVHPLMLPDEGAPFAEVARSAAVQLWCDRATAALRGFALTQENAELVVRVCRRLDGLPLAIELAAARLRVLSLEEIDAALEGHLELLVAQDRGQPERHRTLRATLDWSFRLLAPQEQRLLAELSVFHGGFTLDAASAVRTPESGSRSTLDVVSGLIDRSLVTVTDRGRPTRYRLLVTVRMFAAEQLADPSAVERRQLDYFLALAETAEQRLTGPAQQEWLNLLDGDVPNLVATLRWAVGRHAAPEAGLRLVCALSRFWYLRGLYAVGRHWIDAALAAAGTVPEELRAKGLAASGRFAYLQADYAVAEERLVSALDAYRALRDTDGTAAVLQSLGSVARERGDYHACRDLHRASRDLWRSIGRADEVARSSNNLAFVAWLSGAPDEALAESASALEHFASDSDGEGGAWALIVRGAVASDAGDLVLARSLLDEARRDAETNGYLEGVAWALNLLGVVASRSGDSGTARELLYESLRMHAALGDRWRIASVVETLAAACADHAWAGHLLGTAQALRTRLGVPVPFVERADLAATTASLAALLGTAGLTVAMAAGARAPLERTLQRALERVPTNGDGAR